VLNECRVGASPRPQYASDTRSCARDCLLPIASEDRCVGLAEQCRFCGSSEGSEGAQVQPRAVVGPAANYALHDSHIMTKSDRYPDIIGKESLRPSSVHMITWSIDGGMLMITHLVHNWRTRSVTTGILPN